MRSRHPSVHPPRAGAGLSRRGFLRTAGALTGIAASGAFTRFFASAEAATRPDAGVTVSPFPLNQVRLRPGRFLDNQNRMLSYLRFLDADRLLWTWRRNVGLSTGSAQQVGGWESPDGAFRGQAIGHFLIGLHQAWLATGDTQYRTKADYIVGELAKIQDAAPAAGYHAGYLSAFPESFFDQLEAGQGYVGVPWYVIHKTLQGLVQHHVATGNAQALTVALRLAEWIDWRTARLSYAQMQQVLQTEYGGMNDALALLSQVTNDNRWMTVARRFEHAVVFDPLAANQDRLAGLHANTQLGKLNGALREYYATGEQRYRTITENFWNFVVHDHTYVNGGNSNYEFFQTPRAIASQLSDKTCETCNVYNMLKLTRGLFFLDPGRAEYMDYYERALYNQILGQQDPNSEHGFVCYSVPLRPGAIKEYSNDYDTFWCCVNTGWESHTKLADSIYFQSGETLYVNLYIPSDLTWTGRGLTVGQTTSFPVSDTITLTIGGSGHIALKLRIPSWTSNARIAVNGVTQNVAASPGTYATIDRTWSNGDTVTLTLPMSVRLESAPDDAFLAGILYGPVLLAGAYGTRDLGSSPPALVAGSVSSTGTPLRFTATADGASVDLLPFYDTHHQRYTVYWSLNGPRSGWFRIQNLNSGKVLGVDQMSTANSARVVQYADNGTADHRWRLVPDGSGNYKIVNQNSGKLLGVDGMSTADSAIVVQYEDNGTADHLWKLLDNGDGTARIQNLNSGKVLGVAGMSTADSAQVVQFGDTGTADHLWRLIPDGTVRIQNRNSGKVLGVDGMSTADSAIVVQYEDNGTEDHLWQFLPDASGWFRIRNVHSGKVLGVDGMSTADSAQVVQFGDTGTADHLWRLRYGSDGWVRIENKNSLKVLGVDQMSTANSARVVQYRDSGTADHLWRFL
ncbi:beta-L-arabinofuranosidase domain-containing protein [Vitiosangium sp. GDMCC 1.1324]|uniref:beta-L-arabinofuranosidase domain-containing protein n=1 Tax=Vitiosangium sp. (strain GDMCC 1.1324) TaxID=2138576 RepID=UPI000D39F447|nr:beta-L-arabinofuranosidase domain-containing protein [Vitiosangium sp. GDMCC 1.1324]PTL84836.1 hypothetical protein DAT35_07205 [Vitiosangium sp. GDMCC 1.1324]